MKQYFTTACLIALMGAGQLAAAVPVHTCLNTGVMRFLCCCVEAVTEKPVDLCCSSEPTVESTADSCHTGQPSETDATSLGNSADCCETQTLGAEQAAVERSTERVDEPAAATRSVELRMTFAPQDTAAGFDPAPSPPPSGVPLHLQLCVFRT